MNKVHVFTALLVVMAVTTIVSPVITGTIAKSAYLEQIDNIPSQAGFHINHNSYEQGWFSSKAESELIIDIGHPEFQSLNLIFNSNITHGPVLKDEDGLKLGLAYSEISTKLTNLPEELQLMVEDTFSDYSFDLTAFIGFDQEIKTTFIFPEHKSEVDDISYDFGGLEIFAVGDLAMENSKGDIQLDSSSVESDDVVLSFSDSHGDFNFNKFNDYLYLGTANFMMPSIDVKSNTFNVKLNELNVLAETKENAGKIDLYEQISVKEIVSPIPVTSASYTFEFNQLNPNVFSIWNDFSNSLNDISMKVKTDSNEEVKEPEIDEATLRKLVSEILQEGLEFNQLFEVTAMGGDLILDLDARYAGLPDGLHLLDVEDPSIYIKAVEVNLLLEASEEAVMTSPIAGMVIPYMEQGYLKKENGKLVLRGKIKNGEAVINDISFPLNDMIAMALLNQE